MTNSCQCDPPLPDGAECVKCGRPLKAPKVRRPKPSPRELERRAKIGDYFRGRPRSKRPT